MSLAQRLNALERVAGRPADVTWEEVDAAERRVLERAREALLAIAEGRPTLEHDPVQRAVDEDVLRRWRRQRGVPDCDGDATKARLIDQLGRLAAAEPQ